MSYTQDNFERYARMSSASEDQFKFILNEKISDCLVLKLLIQIENKIGAVLILVSEFTGNILIMYSLFGTSSSIRKLQTFEKLSNFMNNFLKAYKDGGVELAISERIGRTIYRTLIPENFLSIVENLKQKDFGPVRDLLIQGISKETKLLNIQIDIDIEMINSIQFLKKNLLNGIIPEVRNPFEETPPTSTLITQTVSTPQTQPKTKVEIAIDEIIKNYKEVVKCQTVVAPVTGITFEELKPGQPLLFLLPFKTPEERSRARRLGAVNQLGQNQPIKGEFLKLVMAENEYHIFAKGPANVLLRAFEERPVRLAYPKDSYDKLEEKTFRSIILVVAAFVVFILVLFFLYFK